MKVTLREVREDDFETFFQTQSDEGAARQAGVDVRTREAFTEHWEQLKRNPTTFRRSIEVDGVLAGNVGSWESSGQRFLGYSIARAFWGRGVVTEAVRQFVELDRATLIATVTPSNIGSVRVLEKNGFRLIHTSDEDLVYQRDAH